MGMITGMALWHTLPGITLCDTFPCITHWRVHVSLGTLAYRADIVYEHIYTATCIEL